MLKFEFTRRWKLSIKFGFGGAKGVNRLKIDVIAESMQPTRRQFVKIDPQRLWRAKRKRQLSNSRVKIQLRMWRSTFLPLIQPTNKSLLNTASKWGFEIDTIVCRAQRVQPQLDAKSWSRNGNCTHSNWLPKTGIHGLKSSFQVFRIRWKFVKSQLKRKKFSELSF